MAENNLVQICAEINSRSKNYQFGQLQIIRKDLKGLTRVPTYNIFTSATIFNNWAFHVGGRKEIQFNIGVEDYDKVRHALAFSLDTSRSLPNIDILFPKIDLYNEYMANHSKDFTDMQLWYYKHHERYVLPNLNIPKELFHEGIFIAFGKRQPLDSIDYELVLKDFDRLLHLYLFIESKGLVKEPGTQRTSKLIFKSGCTLKSPLSKANYTKKQFERNLRHNVLQKELHDQLAEVYGSENVGTETVCSTGKIDVVRKGDELWFYEIKTANTVKTCFRQALGQLLEYSYWPSNEAPTRLIVVGEAILDKEGKRFLKTLQKQFSLPIEYEQLIINQK